MNRQLIPTYVYVASAGELRQKVGISTDPVRRLADLSGACGYRLDLAMQLRADHALDVEKMAHWLLRERRQHGEWFEVNVATAKAAVSRAEKLVDEGLNAPCRLTGTGPRKAARARPGGRSVNRLNWRRVVTLTEPGLHADGGGLYLRIDLAGAKRWTFIYQWNKRRREMGLGPIRTVSLAEARDLAEIARKQVRNGIDPIAAKATKIAA